MAEIDQDQKTEEPTQKRLTEATEKGQFARAAEIGVVFGLVAGLLALSLSLGEGLKALTDYTTGTLSRLHGVSFNIGEVPLPLREAGFLVMKVIAPVLMASVIAALVSGGLQSGFNLTPKVLGFHLDKLNPVAGLQRIFSQRSLVHAGVDFAKMLAVGASLYLAMREILADPLFTTPMETAYLGVFMKNSAFGLIGRLALVLALIAAVSYTYEKYKTHREQMMTRHEVKEEHKAAEGSPHVKIAIRRMARRLAQRQMLAAVPTADVVVTNPTHYAVALKYERGVDAAPVVLAKGEDAFARRIKTIAAAHEVPMVENRPVARLLYATSRVGEPIPSELYQAVATILAFVYRTHRYYFYRLPARRAAAAARGTASTQGGASA